MITAGAVPLGLVTLSGLLGLLIGSFLNVVAYRVPAGVSLLRPSRCPRCDAGLRWWQNVPVISWLVLRGRCASCAAPIGVRYPLVELATAALFAAVAWTVPVAMPLPALPTAAVLLAFWWFAGVSVVLTLIDLDSSRLPDAIVLPSYPVGLALFGLACLLGADWTNLARAAVGMAVLYAGYAALRLIRPDGMGGGDVKLAGLAGLHLGWLGWAPLAVGGLAGFVFGGLFGLTLLALGRANRRTAVPFGPWLLLGTWAGAIAGQPLGRLYGDLYGLL